MAPKEHQNLEELRTEENCKSSKRIRDFLRLSRTTDDTIRQQINGVPTSNCKDYFTKHVIPEWQIRSSVIEFCKGYAKDLRKETEEKKLEQNRVETSGDFNLRLDPYALKNHKDVLERQFSQCDMIDNWVRNESQVEGIIREQTVEVLNEKCYYNDWMEEFKKFNK